MDQLNVTVFSKDASVNDPHISADIGLAYLLGEKVIATGMLEFFIKLMEPGSIKSVMVKLDVLIRFHARVPEVLETLEELKKNLIKGEKIKNRGKDMIVAMEKMKRMVEGAYAAQLKALGELDHWKKYTVLHQLVKNNDLYSLPSSNQDSEYEDEEEGYAALSSVFQHRLNSLYWPHPDYYFFLCHHVLDNGLRKQVSETAPANAEHKSLPLLYLFRIPDVLLLSPLEINHLRTTLQPVLAPVRQILKTLYAKLNEGEEDSLSHQWAAEMLAPVVPVLNEAIQGHPFIQTLIATNPLVPFYDVCLGLVNQEEIWRFYDALGQIPDETRAVLEEGLEPPERRYATRPFLMARPNLENLPYEPVLGTPSWMGKTEHSAPEETPNPERKILDL